MAGWLSIHPSCCNISRVPDQNGVSLLYIMFEMHHSGREPSIYYVQFSSRFFFFLFCRLLPYLFLVMTDSFAGVIEQQFK